MFLYKLLHIISYAYYYHSYVGSHVGERFNCIG